MSLAGSSSPTIERLTTGETLVDWVTYESCDECRDLGLEKLVGDLRRAVPPKDEIKWTSIACSAANNPEYMTTTAVERLSFCELLEEG